MCYMNLDLKTQANRSSFIPHRTDSAWKAITNFVDGFWKSVTYSISGIGKSNFERNCLPVSGFCESNTMRIPAQIAIGKLVNKASYIPGDYYTRP
jgi:hypothetical protein